MNQKKLCELNIFNNNLLIKKQMNKKYKSLLKRKKNT